MKQEIIFNKSSLIVALATLVFSLILFYHDTGMFFGSLAAASLAAGLAWASYILVRLIWLALTK